jgi:prophage regulatory protein
MSKLLRLTAVKDLTGLSRSSIYAHPDFPRPVKIGAGGRAVAWVEHEIHDWVNARIDQREVTY